MKNLNTLETFRKEGFKIEREGKIISLSKTEMEEFRYLDQALTGLFCLECYNPENEQSAKIIDEFIKNDRICHDIDEAVLDILMDDCYSVERDVIDSFIDKYIAENLKKTEGAE